MFIESSFVEPLRFVPYHAEPKQEWSYVDVHEGAHMFYWLYYTTAQEGFQQVPLVMWLQVAATMFLYML